MLRYAEDWTNGFWAGAATVLLIGIAGLRLCCSFTPFEVGWCAIGDAVPYALWIVSRSQSHHHDTPGANPENGVKRRRPFAVQILTQRGEGEGVCR